MLHNPAPVWYFLEGSAEPKIREVAEAINEKLVFVVKPAKK